MPCPHNEITIVQRSQRQSAVAAAAYQSGEKLFCEYDQQVKHYPEKRGIVHNEILLPANAPRSYADRNTLWNAAEAVEKQWNSQLARRWVLTIPREIPPDQYAVLVREFCEQQFVSKGMIADFAIHDPHPPGHNPHAHVMLTMRAMDEHGKWLPKSRKVYDLDENGERIKLPSGRWKSHKEDTVDWNDQKYCEIWRHEWEVIQNRYLEANDRPERVDLQDLQSRNERMFLVTFLVLNTADNPRQLDNNVFQASSIAQKYNCQLTRLDFQQEEGLMSALPLGLNQIEIQRGLTTSSTAIFVPFTTQELFQNGKEALYYGINALSNNLIMVDRKLLKNPNGLILGTPGSGKSFSAKREIANCFLLTNDDIIICDPEAEYAPLVERLHGQVIKISPTSTNYINPMDLNLDYSDDESPLSLKSDFILSLCELIVGGKEGLQPVQKTIIDRCVRLVYQTYLNDPRPENMPILEDLYNLLRAQEEKEAQYIATALEIYVTGSLNVFNHQSNVDINNRIVCYDIKELGKQLKKIGMLVVQDQVWNRVTINRAAHKSTRYYIDEMHLLLKEEQTAAYTVEIWKRFRKWGGIPTGITQNVKDLLSSREVENIFENSDFVYMLNQAGGDRQILAKQLGISPHQLSYVTHSSEGEGLLFYGSTILPFVDHFPKNTELYRIMTTKPQELKKEDE